MSQLSFDLCVHYWIYDSFNQGKCQKCGAEHDGAKANRESKIAYDAGYCTSVLRQGLKYERNFCMNGYYLQAQPNQGYGFYTGT